MRQWQAMPPGERPEAARKGMCSVRPASRWQDALISGNGRMRIQVFGDPFRERIHLGHERLYVPQWRQAPEPPDISSALPEVKRLLLEGRYEEASALALERARASGVAEVGFSELHNAASLLLETDERGSAFDYLRWLDMDTGEVETSWRDAEGEWRRSVFVSRADNVVVLRIAPPPGRNGVVKLRIDPRAETDNERDPVRWLDVRPNGDLAFDTASRRPDTLTATGTYKPYARKRGFAVVVRAAGGQAALDADGSWRIEGAAPLLICRVVPLERDDPEAAERAANELGALAADYDGLLASHKRLHEPMMARTGLRLGDGADGALAVEELMERQYAGAGIQPALAEKLYRMGQYFLAAYTGELPPLYGHINININLQLSYANLGRMTEAAKTYFDWVERMLDDARLNARRLLGTRGFQFAAHPDADSNSLYHFYEDYPHHYWLSGSGWALQPYLEYYQTTGDERFLKERMLPLYAELAELYEDFLTERDGDGKSIFVPSYSPENKPDGLRRPLAVNAVMDIAVCREVLETLVAYGSLGGIEPARTQRWRDMLDRLPDYRFGPHGELKEWAWDGLEDRYDHRHVSHLYGAWPGFELRREEGSPLLRAARIANRKRGPEDQSAHGVMHRALAAARLRDGELVERQVKLLLEAGFVNTSLMTNHYPFRFYFPDALGAFPTLLAEAALFSSPGLLELLPAWPESLPKGELNGLATRAGVIVERFSWDLTSGDLELAWISRQRSRLTLASPRGVRVESATGAVCFSTDRGTFEFDCTPGQTVRIRLSTRG